MNPARESRLFHVCNIFCMTGVGEQHADDDNCGRKNTSHNDYPRRDTESTMDRIPKDKDP